MLSVYPLFSQFAEETFFLFLFIAGIRCDAVHRIVETSECFFLLFCQLLRYCDHKGYKVVAADVLVAECRNTFSSETHFCIGLSSRFYLVLDFSVYCLDADCSAKGCCREGDRHCGVDGCILTFEYRMSGYGYLY